MLEFLTQKTPPIGLDIGRDGVRMLQLAPVGKTVAAVAAARWKFPDTAADDADTFRGRAVEAVRQMLADGRFRGRRVVSCLNSDELVVKQIRMPRLSEAERRSAVQWEANERFGFAVNPDMLHHWTAGEVRSGGEVRDEVILLGAREETVDAHVAMLGEMGLQPACVDAEPAAVFRPFERFLRRGADGESVSLLVDVGATSTWVVFARGRNVGFLKSIDIGGRHFNRAVAEQLNLEYAEAVNLRRQAAQGAAGSVSDSAEQVRRSVFDAVRPIAEALTREISLCLRYCSVTFRGSRPEKILLVGGQGQDPIIRDLMKEYINIDSEPGRPLRGIDLSAVELGGDQRGPMGEWTVAAGLALREVLADMERRERKHARNRLSA